MANRLQFKRGNGRPSTVLRAAEPAYDLTDGLLYVGLSTSPGDSNAGQLIGGKSYVDRVDDFLDENGNLSVSGVGTVATLELGSGGQGVQATIILDEDTLSSNRADAIPTQQSVKAYIDNATTGGGGDINVVNLDASGYVQVGTALTVNGDAIITGITTIGDSSLDLLTINSRVSSNITPDGDGTRFIGADGAAWANVYSYAADIGAGNNAGVGLTVSNDAYISGNVTADGTVDFNSTVDIQGNANLQADLDVAADVRVARNLEVTGIATVTSDLDVDGTSNFQGNVQLQNNLDVDGTADIQGNANLQADLDVAADVRVARNLEVTGIATVTSDLDVDGTSNLQGDVTLQNNLSVASDVSVTQNIEVTGLSTFTGAAQFGGSVNISGDLTVSGSATQVNFEVRDVTIEDRLLELGTESGGAPTSPTTWDLGLALNYNDGVAKKAAVVWQDNTGFNLASRITESSGAGNADPQVAIGEMANLGVNGVYIGDVTTTANLTIDSSKNATFNDLYIGDEIGTSGNLFAQFNGTTNLVDITNASFDGGSY